MVFHRFSLSQPCPLVSNSFFHCLRLLLTGRRWLPLILRHFWDGLFLGEEWKVLAWCAVHLRLWRHRIDKLMLVAALPLFMFGSQQIILRNARWKSWCKAPYNTGFTAALKNTNTVELYSSARGTALRLTKIAQRFAIPRGIQQQTNAITTARSTFVTRASINLRRLLRFARVDADDCSLRSENSELIMLSVDIERLSKDIVLGTFSSPMLRLIVDSLLSLSKFCVNSKLNVCWNIRFPCDRICL